jgi:hypothetical protein
MVFTTQGQAKKQTKLSYLGNVASSIKIAKNKKKGVFTYILYLAPAHKSGYNVCPKATLECINACLAGSGHNRIDVKGRIDNSRIKKTKLFFEDREFFMSWLIAELHAHQLKAEKKGYKFSVRLNGTSDISPLLFKHNGKTLFELFKSTQFYDYTKVLNRVKLTDTYKNYDLTFSYSGYNWSECDQALKQNVRVAVVFEGGLPKTYRGYKVIDGDLTDIRYYDEKNVIVGLKYKKVKNKVDLSNNPFIIRKDDINSIY